MLPRPPSGNSYADAKHRLLYRRPAYALQNEPVTSPRQLAAILLSVIVCGLAFWIRLIIEDILPPGFPFITFFPAIILSTFVLGMWPGIVSAVTGGILSIYYFIPPLNGFEMTANSWVAIGFYIFISAAFILTLTAMDSALRRADLAQRQAEANSEYQSVVAREMNHRIKNLFGVINSIVRLTARSSADTSSFATQLAGRISSLSHAHELVWESAGRPDVSVREVIERILAPHRSQASTAVDISVSDHCTIEDPHVLQVLSLLVYELATNASKYGAFSSPEGSLHLTADIQPASGETARRLVLSWNERFVSLQPPTETTVAGPGFGTELMKRLVAGVSGAYAHEVKPGEGVDVRVELPLEQQAAQS